MNDLTKEKIITDQALLLLPNLFRIYINIIGRVAIFNSKIFLICIIIALNDMTYEAITSPPS